LLVFSVFCRWAGAATPAIGVAQGTTEREIIAARRSM